jgi:hypothetical protein
VALAALATARERAPEDPRVLTTDGLFRAYASGGGTRDGVDRLEAAVAAFRREPERWGRPAWWPMIARAWLGGFSLLLAQPERTRAVEVLTEALALDPAAEPIREVYLPQTVEREMEAGPVASASGWRRLGEDPAGDGADPAGTDAAAVSLLDGGAAGAVSDTLWFRIDLHRLADPERFGINLAIDTDLDAATGQPWWGRNRAFTYDRVVTAWVVRQGRRYSGTIGVADAAHAAIFRLSNLSRDVPALALDPARPAILVGLPASLVDDDGRFRLVVAVGSHLNWNDDLPDRGSLEVTLPPRRP